MTEHLQLQAPARPGHERPLSSRVRIVWGKASFEAESQISPMGLLAIGGMVGTMLLAAAAVLRAGSSRRL